MKTIGIVGFGYVGKAMFRFFNSHYPCVVYDPDIDKILASFRYPEPTGDCRFTSKRELINECDLAVVCVPTPMLPNGGCNIDIVEEVISWLETPLILLKSTVPPGVTDNLMALYEKDIVFSPEYCGESSYWTPYKFHTDVKETPFFIFGGHPDATSKMVDYFLPIAGPVKFYRQTDARSAEFAKYMENSFYAMKIAFCYEFAEIAKVMEVDFNEARELWLLDPRINPMHTAVFAENKKPFGGKCLPKDLSAIIRRAEIKDYEPKLLKEVLASNERIGKAREESSCPST